LAFGDGDAGEFFEEFDIGDEAVVDDFLREVHELGAGAEGSAQGTTLVGPEQLLINGEAGEPADFRFHRDAWREHGSEAPSAKREAGEIFLANLSAICRSVGGMKTHTTKVLPVLAGLALGATVMLNSGCLLVAAGAAGAGTVAYVRGELAASLGNDFGAVTKATGRAIEQLKFAKVSENADALSARFVVRTAQDKKIEVELTKIGEALTKVEIRVGVFGDETVSMTVLDKIKANL
jgi:hypothetical protein